MTSDMFRTYKEIGTYVMDLLFKSSEIRYNPIEVDSYTAENYPALVGATDVADDS